MALVLWLFGVWLYNRPAWNSRAVWARKHQVHEEFSYVILAAPEGFEVMHFRKEMMGTGLNVQWVEYIRQVAVRYQSDA